MSGVGRALWEVNVLCRCSGRARPCPAAIPASAHHAALLRALRCRRCASWRRTTPSPRSAAAPRTCSRCSCSERSSAPAGEGRFCCSEVGASRQRPRAGALGPECGGAFPLWAPVRLLATAACSRIFSRSTISAYAYRLIGALPVLPRRDSFCRRHRLSGGSALYPFQLLLGAKREQAAAPSLGAAAHVSLHCCLGAPNLTNIA